MVKLKLAGQARAKTVGGGGGGGGKATRQAKVMVKVQGSKQVAKKRLAPKGPPPPSLPARQHCAALVLCGTERKAPLQQRATGRTTSTMTTTTTAEAGRFALCHI
jgi:hypothetical protein